MTAAVTQQTPTAANLTEAQQKLDAYNEAHGTSLRLEMPTLTDEDLAALVRVNSRMRAALQRIRNTAAPLADAADRRGMPTTARLWRGIADEATKALTEEN